tara:strand:+ start:46 stop:2289 length:2244 start_codon:yes stop_codon:yes gene_type:complete
MLKNIASDEAIETITTPLIIYDLLMSLNGGNNKALFVADTSRTEGVKFHNFFLLWPNSLNENNSNGKIFITSSLKEDGESDSEYIEINEVISNNRGGIRFLDIKCFPPKAWKDAGYETCILSKNVDSGNVQIKLIHSSTLEIVISFLEMPTDLDRLNHYWTLLIKNQTILSNYLIYLLRSDNNLYDDLEFVRGTSYSNSLKKTAKSKGVGIGRLSQSKSQTRRINKIKSKQKNERMSELNRRRNIDKFMAGGNKKNFMVGGNKKNFKLTANQKTHLTFMICCAAACHRYALEKFVNTSGDTSFWYKLKKNNLVDQQNKMMRKMLTVTNNKLPSFGSNDDIHLNNFKNWVKKDITNNNKLGFIDAEINEDDNFIKNLSKKSEIQPLLKKFEDLTNNNKKFYLSNSVTAGKKLGEILYNEKAKKGRYFCTLGSIMDNQPSCKSTSSESKLGGRGLEWGIFDVTIKNSSRILENKEKITDRGKMSYRIRVEPTENDSNGIPQKSKIYAYYKLGDKVIINVGNPKSAKNWPAPVTNSDGIELNEPEIIVDVGTNTKKSPLDAKMTYKDLIGICLEKLANNGKTRGIESFLNQIKGNDSSEFDLIRLKILNISFRKSLGDVIQELMGVVKNGGYIDIPYTSIKSRPTTLISPRTDIAIPNEGRIMLSNDRPAGVRTMIYILYGKPGTIRDRKVGGINPNILGGFITNKNYYIAYRNNEKIGIKGGSLKNKKKKIRQRKKITQRKKIRKTIKI